MENRLELGIQRVLAGAQVHGADRQAVADPTDVGERETVHPLRVPVAVSAGEIAVVREPEPDGEAGCGGGHDARTSSRTRQSVEPSCPGLRAGSGWRRR